MADIRCVCIMRGVNMWHTCTSSYHNTAEQMGLHHVKSCLAQWRLTWLDHVRWMDINTTLGSTKIARALVARERPTKGQTTAQLWLVNHKGLNKRWTQSKAFVYIHN